MENKILGIHHITAIAGNSKRNYDFYTKVLGLRFIKKTVNFDDPGTYHFYFGDEVGSPGTILTFFPWEGIAKGRQGNGMATDIGYSVPDNSLAFWAERLNKNNVIINSTGTRFGEKYLAFEDPDGLPLSLIISNTSDKRKPWATADVKADVATKGFHSITLTLKTVENTAKVLTDILDYKFVGKEENRHRYRTDTVENAAIVDLIEDTNAASAVNAGGTIHHIAFRVKDEMVLMEYREKVVRNYLNITQKIDRN